MIHNRPSMNVVRFSRLDQIALEPPPNDVEAFQIPLPPIQGLGGPTAPRGGGGMVPPQNGKYNPETRELDPVVVATSRAPECRQDYTNDGGSIIATPPASVTKQESQKGVAGAVGEWKDAQVFEK